MKFCQFENVEHHFWKLLYYNTIELLRKSLAEEEDSEKKLMIKTKIREIIENGAVFLEKLLALLETTYKFSLDDYLGVHAGGE